MSEITKAIEARQAQIIQLQSDIETLQRAASVLGGETTARATSQPKTKSKPKRKRGKKGTAAKAIRQPKAKTKPEPKTAAKQKRKRPTWSAADKAAISKRMKAYWAKRRKAKG